MEVFHPGLSSGDQLTYWLLRLSEALQRLHEGLLWAGASPGEFGAVLSAPMSQASPLGLDVAHAAEAMRRFADLLLASDNDNRPPAFSVWEDLLLSLRVLLLACATEAELWFPAQDPDPRVAQQMKATVYAVERLCTHFEQVH